MTCFKYRCFFYQYNSIVIWNNEDVLKTEQKSLTEGHAAWDRMGERLSLVRPPFVN